MGAEIYTARSTPQEGAYTITKFDNDYNMLTSYIVARGECNCPRGEQGKTCRHQDMIRIFAKTGHVDDGWFFNYNTRQWLPAIATGADDDDADVADEENLPAPESSSEAPPPAPHLATASGGATTFRKRRF